jgi:isoquinoline 1-oxidoreductase beta subunit
MSTLTRRQFLQSTAVTTLTVAMPLPWPKASATSAKTTPVENAYLRLTSDNQITAVLPTAEMGQGTHTGQLMILGEELGVNPQAIQVEMPLRPSEPYRLSFGQMRSVGSFGIRAWHDPLRKAAAQTRAVLIAAASDRLQVAVDELNSADGAVVHKASGRRIPFGDLVSEAARLALPDNPPLLPEAERHVTGRAMRRVDTPAKVNGSAVYGTDVKVPNMVHGAVRMSPVYGADVVGFERASIADFPGVIDIVPIPNGVVVVADTWWRAKKAADALNIQFTSTPHDQLSSAELSAAMKQGLSKDIPTVLRQGDIRQGLEQATKTVEAIYEVPFLTHGCMEPMVCTAHTRDDHVELWMPTQGHDIIRMTVERVTGLSNEQMTLHTTYLGGGFGRKTHGELAEQAILASRAVGRPVKVMWAREDDIQQGYYRPIMMVRFRAGLDDNGQLTALQTQLSGPQMGQTFEHITVEDNYDYFSVAVLADQPYGVEHYALDHRHLDVPMPLSPWRAVSSSQNGFFLEAFVDELAQAAGKDPVVFRREHLAQQPRHLAVLNRVVEMSGWEKPAAEGIHRGVAVVASYDSVVAQVVELRMENATPKVEQVYVAIDCGRAINPDSVIAQMEGSVAEALAAALRHQVEIADGRAQNSNFNDYQLLRLNEMPQVKVAIVDTGAPLGGVGEPGLPPLAPALTNAIFSATGQRIRKLPILNSNQLNA